MEDKRLLKLIKKARFGDKEAFGELVKEKGRKILFISTNLMGNSQDGEDAAQEAVLTLAQKIATLKKAELFDAWMYRIIFNVCMDEKRKKKRKLDDSAEMDIAIATVAENNAEVLPEEKLEQKASREAIMAALNELPERYRICILLYYYEDKSYAEIANVLQVSEQVVANTLNRAKEKLRSGYELSLAKAGLKPASAPFVFDKTDENERAVPMGAVVKAGAFIPAIALGEALKTSETLAILPGAVSNLSAVAAKASMPKGLLFTRFVESVVTKAVTGVACAAIAAGGVLYISQNVIQPEPVAPLEQSHFETKPAEIEEEITYPSAHVEGLPEGSRVTVLVEGRHDEDLDDFYKSQSDYEFSVNLESKGYDYSLYNDKNNSEEYVLVITPMD